MKPLRPFLRFSIYRRQGYLLITALSVLVVFILCYSRPIGFGSDAAWGLKALQQYQEHQTPSINHTLNVSTTDLSQDSIGWIYAWPMGVQVIFFPFIKFGLSVGEATRWVILIFTLLGCLGWIKWALRFKVGHFLLLFMATILPWLRFATLPYFYFGPDLLVFGCVPWVLLYITNLAYRPPPKYSRLILHSTAAGFITGSLYIIKWSASFVSLGILIWWIIDSLKSKPRRLFSAIVFSIACILPIVGYSLLNKHLGGYANTLTGDMIISINLSPFIFIGSLGTLGLALFDLESLLNFIFFHPSRPELINIKWLGIFGILAFPVIIWLLKRALKRRPPYKEYSLAIILILSSLFAVLLLTITINPKFASERYWFIYVTRYIRPAVLAFLPVLLLGMRGVLKAAFRLRILLFLSIFIYCVIPCLYSFTAFFVKLQRVIPSYGTGPSGVYNPLLSPVSTSAILKDINSLIRDPRDVVFVTDPVTWLDIDSRSFCIHADFFSKERLLSIGLWRTLQPLRLIMVLPKHFELNSKGDLLRRMVPQSQEWRVYTPEIPSPVNIWYSDLEVKE